MRGVGLLLLLLCAASVARAGEDETASRASVEATASPETVYVGQGFELRLLVTFDRAFFEAHAAPLFHQAMEVPIQVRAPWMRALPGAVALDGASEEASTAPEHKRFALGDAVVTPSAVRNVDRAGRVHTILELRTRYRAETPGALLLEAPSLRFVHAARFEEDFVGGRIAVDPRDATVTGEPLTVRVQPLPRAGRPATFGGAVGSFSLSAEVDRDACRVGEILTLILRIEGEGNLSRFDAPRLDELDGFHLSGRVDDRSRSRRTIRYELAPVSADVKAVPAIELAFFDPRPPARYRVVRTEAIALRVTPARAPAPSLRPPSETPVNRPVWEPWLFGAVVLVLALAWLRRLRRRGSSPHTPPVDPARTRIDTAEAALADLGESGAPDAADAFAEFLAAHLRCPQAAVIGTDLRARLVAHGLDEALVARAADALEDLVSRRYAAEPPPRGSGAVPVELVGALRRAFQAEAKRP